MHVDRVQTLGAMRAGTGRGLVELDARAKSVLQEDPVGAVFWSLASG